MEEFEEIRGDDGEAFSLEKALTWDLFQEVLHDMPKQKSVGASGLSVELLIAAGKTIQREFYDALMADVHNRVIPHEWRRVLYVLLVKPAPNRADVVDQRREIALMAQELKLFMQMVRRVAYSKVIGRISAEQGGWIGGYGVTDTGFTAQCAIQQARAQRKTIYLLYIDLATFFPRIDRDMLAMAEELHGLPKEVWELTKRIYGSLDDPEGAVQCQYDSAAGLGEAFPNTAGALMGCVLSPDKAKLLLNTLVVAINAVCKGFRWWGCSEDEIEGLRSEVAQLAFADDWLGIFESEAELRKAWSVWKVWEAISGSKLGVKGQLKTVVTGATYTAAGVMADVLDPELKLRGGGTVPFIGHREAYKHVGNWRCAGGDEAIAFEKLSAKIDVALQRLRRMHRPSINQFMTVSNSLISGLANFHLQTLYISFEQAEEIEKKWRGVYRSKFGRGFSEERSKPRAYYYQPKGGGGVRRKHLWAVGLEAIVTRFGAAMADPGDTPQRVAARSTLAMALERWGCRSDPGRWEWGHLTTALEASLKSAKCKQLGDAWMLATALLEGEAATRWADDERSAWTRDFAGERASLWGRWKGELPRSDPLHRDAAHWEAATSAAISEPVARGGLGMRPEEHLLAAGVTAVGHMCKRSVEGEGDERYVYRRSYDAARRCNGRLPQHGAGAAAWTRQIERLEAAGVAPCAPEGGAISGGGSGIARAWDVMEAASAKVTVAHAAAERLVDGLEEHWAAVGEHSREWSEERWATELRSCFQGVQRRAASEWRHGARDREAQARGARRVLVMGGPTGTTATGGECGWMMERADDGSRAIGADGWYRGHEEEAEKLLATAGIDEEGFAVSGAGKRLDEGEVAELQPAVQLWARSRLRVGSEVPCVDEWPPVKKEATHVNVAVARQNRREAAEWQAKIRATAAFTGDGTRQAIKEESGAKEFVVARAAMRHDGTTAGGRLVEVEGADNYLAELAALIDVLEAEAAGGRILIVTDASSPPQALLRFTQLPARKRAAYKAAGWIDALDAAVDRHALVVFLWQTSHVGSPWNEAADLAADAAAAAAEVVAVPRRQQRFASIEHTAPQRSVARWAAGLSDAVVEGRLMETVRQSMFHDRTMDMPRAEVTDGVAQLCEAVLAQRSCFGDDRRHMGKARLGALNDRRCPFGCFDNDGVPAKFTWLHAQTCCGEHEIAAARGEWRAVVEECAEAFGNPATGAGHSQLLEVIRALDAAAAGGGTRLSSAEANAVRRVAGGCVRSRGGMGGGSGLAGALRRLTIAGAKVQVTAKRLTAGFEEAALMVAQGLQRVRKWAKLWRTRTVEAGPRRMAALREVHESEGRAVAAVHLEFTAWVQEADRTTEEEGEAWDRLVEVLGSIVTVGVREGQGSETTTRARLEGARRAHPRSGQRAYQEWKLLAMLSGWRCRAAARRWPGGAPGGVTRDVEGEASLQEAAGTRHRIEVHRARLVESGEGERRAVLRLPECNMSFWSQRQGLQRKESRARKAWAAGGRAKGEAARRAAWALAKARLEKAEERTRFKRFLAQARGEGAGEETGSKAVVGLSGRILAEVRSQTVVIEPRHTKRRRATGTTAQAAPKRAARQSTGTAPPGQDSARPKRRTDTAGERTQGKRARSATVTGGDGRTPGVKRPLAVVMAEAGACVAVGRAMYTGWHMTCGRWWHESEEFVLRDITGRRKSRGVETDGVRIGVWLYRVRYVGWPDDLEWWEPAANLNAADVAAFVEHERACGGTSG